MVDCTLPVLSVATCEYQEFFDNRTQCNGRSMFEGHCPFRKYVEDAPADSEESAGTDTQQAKYEIVPCICRVIGPVIGDEVTVEKRAACPLHGTTSHIG